MGWTNKKQEVPEIPPSPQLPELPKKAPGEKRDLPELPSFPDDKSNFNHEMVKSAVNDYSDSSDYHESYASPVDKEDDVGSQPRGFQQNAIPPVPKPLPKPPFHEENQPQNTNQRRTIEINEQKEKTKSNEPIFVRIDKFQSAQKNFDNIKSKVKEIETTLKKVQDLKDKEEKEITEWSNDLEKIKSRLTEIDSEIFDQI